VRLPEFARSTTFRWTLGASAAFAVAMLLMLGFVYWRATVYLTAANDRLIKGVADGILDGGPGEVAPRLEAHLASDPRRVKITGLFDGNGRRVAGNLERIPLELTPDGHAQYVPVVRIDNRGREEQTVRAIARPVGDGRILVVGRDVEEREQFSAILGETLALSLVPALCLGLAAGAFLSLRAQRRIKQVNERVQRIVAGDLRERLPAQPSDDPFDRLAALVNGMLDDIEVLVDRLAGVGDDIAHDLRTPLTRVRIGLERARQNATRLEDLQKAVDQAMAGLDQSLTIITALLRIAEIEHGRRLAGFRTVELSELVREVGDLYEPIAEDKKIEFAVAADEVTVEGDRDLLFEAVANLVDNAVKFTPEGGRVELSVRIAGDDAVVRVSDTGPGIAASERELVGRRFYRSDKSRSHPGLGLGLSLVNAIVKLHGFQLRISPGPGCVTEITGRRATFSGPAKH
jgi:signal transduction histidine kinase